MRRVSSPRQFKMDPRFNICKSSSPVSCSKPNCLHVAAVARLLLEPARRGRSHAGVESGHDVEDLHVALEVGERDIVEIAASETEVASRAAPDLGELDDGVNGMALERDVGHGLSSPPTATQGGRVGYHATMR